MHKKPAKPRYDDINHIDSSAIRYAPPRKKYSPIEDPEATSYTEMYCAPTNSIQPQPKP